MKKTIKTLAFASVVALIVGILPLFAACSDKGKGTPEPWSPRGEVYAYTVIDGYDSRCYFIVFSNIATQNNTRGSWQAYFTSNNMSGSDRLISEMGNGGLWRIENGVFEMAARDVVMSLGSYKAVTRENNRISYDIYDGANAFDYLNIARTRAAIETWANNALSPDTFRFLATL